MTIPQSMKVVEVITVGSPEGLAVCDRPVPTVTSGELLIKVAAAGVNRADIMQRVGHYPPPSGASDILGLEVSGIVAVVGSGVAEWLTQMSISRRVIGVALQVIRGSCGVHAGRATQSRVG